MSDHARHVFDGLVPRTEAVTRASARAQSSHPDLARAQSRLPDLPRGSSVEFIDEQAVTGVGGDAAEPVRPTRQPKKTDRKDRGRSRRRAHGIMAYDGPNGSGKTAAMVYDTLPTLDGMRWTCRVKDHAHTLLGIYEGERYVLANLDLFDSVTGKLHPRAVRLTDWRQVLDAEHCDILFDEVMGIAAARDNAGLPGEVAQLLQKLRHFDIRLAYTTPSFGSAHIDLRRPTKAVTSCRGFFPDSRDKSLAWAPNRLFNWRTFSTEDYDDGAPSKNDRDRTRKVVHAKPAVWAWGPGSRMFASYDTLGVVSVLAKALPAGTCSVCGGRRPVPRCECDSRPGGTAHSGSRASLTLVDPHEH